MAGLHRNRWPLWIGISGRNASEYAEGAVEGVKPLTQEALKAGATKEEIMEALRVADYICGVGCVYTAARAFKDMF